jgi:hypothetical protein
MGASRTGGIGERPHGYRTRESTPDAIRRGQDGPDQGERVTRKMVIEMMGVPPVGVGTALAELGPGAPFVPVRTADGQGA